MKNINDVIATKQRELDILRRDLAILKEALRMMQEPSDSLPAETATQPEIIGTEKPAPQPAVDSPVVPEKKLSRWP